jgi:hypothetical protein
MHAPDNIFIQGNAKSQGDLLGNSRATHVGFRRLASTMALISSLDGPLEPGFPLRWCEKKGAVLPVY